MTFLQPLLLWGLPLAALPLIIHLVNRSRHRPMPWAAMLFLARARRSSTRMERLRRFLILLCRILALLLFVLAAARPLAEGWAGRLFSGPPDTVVLVLDRSASMGQATSRVGVTCREWALQALGTATEPLLGKTRFILLDGAGTPPVDIGDTTALLFSETWGHTAAASDLPALLAEGVETLAAQDAANGEVWVASDLQRSDWAPESPQWETNRAALRSLGAPLPVRLLVPPRAPSFNAGVKVMETRRMTGDGSVLDILIAVEANMPAPNAIPVTIRTGDRTSTVSLPAGQSSGEFHQRVALTSDEAGWGHVVIPDDANACDNTDVWVHDAARTAKTIVTGQDPNAARLLTLAAAPQQKESLRSALTLAPTDIDDASLADAALLIWQAPLPRGGLRRALSNFAESGGRILLLPTDSGPSWSPALAWEEPETATWERPFRVSAWNTDDGPLRHAAAGLPLPVGDIDVVRRRGLQCPDGAAVAWFEDRAPFLARIPVGRGAVWACATRPGEDWSSLGYDIVLLPMLQRLLNDGLVRFRRTRALPCAPHDDLARAERLDTPDTTDNAPVGTRPGIFRLDGNLIATQRPGEEDFPGLLEPEDIRGLMPGIPVSVLRDGASAGRAGGEFWGSLITAAALLFLAEGVLAGIGDRPGGGQRP